MRLPGRVPTGAVLAAVLVVPTVIVAPTLSAARPAPHPVAPQVQHLALSGVDQTALRTAPVPDQLVAGWAARRGVSMRTAQQRAQRAPAVLTSPMGTSGYRMLGVSWSAKSGDHMVVTARTRTGGTWTPWFDLPPMEDVQSGPPPNGRLATAPYWAGDSDGVQIRVDALSSRQPKSVAVDLIEPGTSPADAAITHPTTTGSAFASTTAPNIVTRAEWGADESLRDKHMDMSKTFKVAFVHHTAGSNNYGPNDGPAVVRALYSYYIFTLGYADIGYNFLVDKYGNVYEGRAGSITKTLRDAATGGFNTDTMAIAALGNFETAPASNALVRGIAHIVAYRLSRYHRDPYGTKTLTTEIGPSRFTPGKRVSFKVISGHRDAGYTACPGQHLYDRLGDIRRKAKAYMGSSLVEPSASPRVFHVGNNVAVNVQSRVLQQQNWTLTISGFCDGTEVRQISGTASPSNPIKAVWGGRDDAGNLVPPGRYRLRLTSSGGGTQSWPWSSTVEVGVGGAAAPASGKRLGSTAGGTYVPIKPQVIADSTSGHGIAQPLLMGPGSKVDVPVLGRGGVPASGVSAVAVSVQASCAAEATHVSVAPGGLKVAGSRVVSVDRNGTARGLTLMRLGRGGGLTFRNGSGSVALNVSVVGYVSTSGGGGSLVTLHRNTLKGAGALSVSRAPVDVPVAGRAGVPSDARAVVLNVRRASSSKVSSVWAWPVGAKRPAPSSWRRGTGGASAQRVIVPIGASGDIQLAADRAGKVGLDVAGYVAATDTSKVHPVVPRPLTGGRLRLAGGKARTISVAGRAGVPTGAVAAVVELTGTNASDNARLTLWPRGSSMPSPADLFVPKHADRDDLAVVPIGKGGDIRVAASGGHVGVRVVVLGWVS